MGVCNLTFSNGAVCCVLCAVWPTCIQHGKNKDWCKECGGRRLCQHQRQKHQCRECCALNICPHKTTDQCVGKSGKERGRPRSPSPPSPSHAMCLCGVILHVAKHASFVFGKGLGEGMFKGCVLRAAPPLAHTHSDTHTQSDTQVVRRVAVGIVWSRCGRV